MKALAIVGYKNSGKTTLALALAREFASRGLRVAAAKFSHHQLDRADTDTGRLLEVCDAVAGFGADQSAIFWPERRYLPDLLPLLSADVLLVEGGKSLGWLPRVLLPRAPEDVDGLGPDLALASVGMEVPGLRRIDEVTELADLALERGFILPGLDCGTCGYPTCRELAGRIVAGKLGPDACKAESEALRVTINGQPLGANPFVARVIAGSIRGMLSQLKGYAPGRVEISME